ncbi:protein of unknown function (plasmid) [Ralstonia solanacearum PSI07]|nr:protein of unknown function [Ralstonia solanacearum PSI07]
MLEVAGSQRTNGRKSVDKETKRARISELFCQNFGIQWTPMELNIGAQERTRTSTELPAST